MRLPVLLGLVPLLALSLAHAQDASAPPETAPAVAAEQPAPVVAPPPVQNACNPDGSCAGDDECISGVCTPKAADFTSNFLGFFNRWGLAIGLGAFGEIFPVSSANSPIDSKPQLSALAGARFWLGWQLPKRVRVMGVFDIGYATAGRGINHSSQGVMEGAGLELTLEYFDLVKPFVRVTYDALVIPINTNEQGTLAWSAFYVSAGARISLVEVHLSLGQDLAGGIAPGIGLSFGWLY